MPAGSPPTPTAPLINFALFDLVGLALSPRIRDLGKITLARTGTRSETTTRHPHAGPLLTRRLNTTLIADQWDEMLRLAASLKYGHVSASLIVGRFSRADRQNTLAAALKEYGLARRTIYTRRYLAREDLRRRVSRQLNASVGSGEVSGGPRGARPPARLGPRARRARRRPDGSTAAGGVPRRTRTPR